MKHRRSIHLTIVIVDKELSSTGRGPESESTVLGTAYWFPSSGKKSSSLTSSLFTSTNGSGCRSLVVLILKLGRRALKFPDEEGDVGRRGISGR